jgi:hypothetical protein
MTSAPVRSIIAAFNAAAVLHRSAGQTLPFGSSARQILAEKHVIRIRIQRLEESGISLAVEDNGVDLKRIFRHRLITKADGHSFGLHSCALGTVRMGRSPASRKRRAGMRRHILAGPADQKRRSKKKESLG